jgi:hypothetical protein
MVFFQRTGLDKLTMSEIYAVTEPEENATKVYILTPENDGCVYQTEHWSTMISTRKRVRYEITLNCDSGTFELELTAKERDKLLNQEEINVTNIPGSMCEEVTNGWKYRECIVDKEKYTPEELKEIHNLLYLDPENRDDYESDYEGDVDVSILEQNGWSMDTIYTITNGCVLEEYYS